MARRPLRHSQLIAYENAAAGHHGVLSDKAGDLFIKPCQQAEIDFYEAAQQHPAFAYYLPTFLGTLSMGSGRADGSAALEPPSACQLTLPVAAGQHTLPIPPWTPSNGAMIDTNTAIVLENVTAELKKPNVLDVKLGARLWADDAPLAKRERLDQTALETTSASLGFRIAGMRTWMGHDSEPLGLSHDGFKVFDKNFGRTLTPQTVLQGFRDFFFVESAGGTAKIARKIIKRFLEDLKGLQEVVEHEESRIYSASLLFVYEGDGAAAQQDFAIEREMLPILEARDAATESGEWNMHGATEGEAVGETKGETGEETDGESNEENKKTTEETDENAEKGQDAEPLLPKIQALKVIDFAHARWSPGEGPDENMLQGIQSVRRILEDLLV